MKDIMLDIETLGQRNDPVVFQVAAIQFDRWTGDTGLEFECVIDIQDSLKWGFAIKADTLDWWMQYPELFRKITGREDKKFVHQFLAEFSQWIGKVSVSANVKSSGELSLWGDSSFDQAHIEAMYHKFNFVCAIPFHKFRDYRTMKSLAYSFELEIDWTWTDGEQHNALDDARHQIKILHQIYDQLVHIDIRNFEDANTKV